MTAAAPSRYDAIDGLRAIAILWVAVYHYAVFWSPAGRGLDLVPYGAALSWIPLAEVGGLGVSLFFIVSGFVITFSLQRSGSVLAFLALRLLRLWPTLLLCGSLTFVVTLWLGPPPLMRSMLEFVISMAFLPPEHVGRALGLGPLEWLDGAYWSLWVEVRFYAIAALLYFGTRGHFLAGWAVFMAIGTLLHVKLLPPDHPLLGLLFTDYHPFFTIGIALAAFRMDVPRRVAGFLLISGLVQAYLYAANDLAYALGLTIVCALAITAALSPRAVPFLSAAPLARIGRASYAYYLLHQNLGLALLATVGLSFGVSGAIVAMLVIQLALLALSIGLTERLEAPVRHRLRAVVMRWTHRPAPAA
ncbi:acyltransferase [Jannaschia sp. M317]|uniref:acyltransferase family protein n=1 Tax=Jannaschia sp. M317 TaxID=2867011 RepID=UPI0021A3D92C|nr:acyltransferase [Jannaschia sp. M317]UWQ19952.1 acyltransferase [Jannaschia sp. M317]